MAVLDMLQTPGFGLQAPRLGVFEILGPLALDESGANEVYVQSFPASGVTKVRVSAAGGILPRWRRDGLELFYFAANMTLMAVDVAGGPTGFRPPKVLFPTPRRTLSLNMSGQAAGYAPSLDGQRFLMTRTAESPPQDIDVILNWMELLK